MTEEQEYSRYLITQLFLVDAVSEPPKIHPKKREKKQGAVTKELEQMVQDYEALDSGIDVEPYKEAIKMLRQLKGKDAYEVFKEDLLKPYEN